MRHPDYPFAPRRIEIRPGIALSYLDEGPREGEVVVMLHGNPSWSYYWRRLVLGLRDGYRCIVPDHVGMGLSDKPDDGGGVRPPDTPRADGDATARYDYTLASRVDDLQALLRHAGIDDATPVTLVVHDWGGMVGFGWALAHAAQVRRLVILNTAAFPLPTAKAMPWQLSMGRDSRIGGWLIRRFNLFARGAAWLGTRRRLHEFADRPAFIGWGLRDFVFDRHFLEGFRRALRDAEVHAFEDAGHYVLEDRHEVLVPAIRAFLDAHPLGHR